MLDYVGCFIHGFTETHIDALCHLPHGRGRHVWNGKPFGHSSMPLDHTGTVDFWRDGIVTRGVLYDIPRLRGTDFVAPGAAGARLGARRRRRRAGHRPAAPATRCSSAAATGRTSPPPASAPASASPPGVHASCIEFLADTEAAMLVWDMQDAPNADQGIPNPSPVVDIALHVHHILLPYMGMPILDNGDFEELGGRLRRRSAAGSSSSWSRRS